MQGNITVTPNVTKASSVTLVDNDGGTLRNYQGNNQTGSSITYNLSNTNGLITRNSDTTYLFGLYSPGHASNTTGVLNYINAAVKVISTLNYFTVKDPIPPIGKKI